LTAIFGIISTRGDRLSESDIAPLSDAMSGHSSEYAYREGDGFVFGARLLRTTPESANESQPYRDPLSGAVIVADIRLDNREELLRALQLEHRQIPDCELALEAYLKWGERFPERLLGDFAVVIWDPRMRRLICVRDHLGCKGLSFVHKSGTFAFATESRALVELPWVARQFDDELMVRLIVPEFRNELSADTWYRDVKAVLPAQVVALNTDDRLEKSCYWVLEPDFSQTISSVDDAVEGFTEKFDKAVARRIRGVSEPSVMLSGGIDSASILAALDKISRGVPSFSVATYSTISDQVESCVESQCILRLTEKHWVKPRFLNLPSCSGMLNINELSELAWTRANPVKNDILLPAAMVLAAARDGYKVMLHGASGDLALWSDRFYIADLIRQGRWREAFRESGAAIDHHTYHFGLSRSKLLIDSAARACLPNSMRRALQRFRGMSRAVPDISMVNRSLATRIDLETRLSQLPGSGAEQGLGSDAHVRVLSQIVSGVSGFNLAGSACGIEMRDPFSDRELIAYLLSLKSEFRVHAGWTKYPARKGYENEIGSFVAWRRGKEHLGSNVIGLVSEHDRDYMKGCIEAELGELEPWFEPDRVRGLMAADNNPRFLYYLVTLIKWVQAIRSP
jgi:asparagine synthase (glutamine-hydrolysing)